MDKIGKGLEIDSNEHLINPLDFIWLLFYDKLIEPNSSLRQLG